MVGRTSKNPAARHQGQGRVPCPVGPTSAPSIGACRHVIPPELALPVYGSTSTATVMMLLPPRIPMPSPLLFVAVPRRAGGLVCCERTRAHSPSSSRIDSLSSRSWIIIVGVVVDSNDDEDDDDDDDVAVRTLKIIAAIAFCFPQFANNSRPRASIPSLAAAAPCRTVPPSKSPNQLIVSGEFDLKARKPRKISPWFGVL